METELNWILGTQVAAALRERRNPDLLIWISDRAIIPDGCRIETVLTFNSVRMTGRMEVVDGMISGDLVDFDAVTTRRMAIPLDQVIWAAVTEKEAA